jgi:hypothetical protein
LAFRAAAGEIPMPDEAESKFKPWKHIDVESAKTSAERTKNLEKQLDIIQKKLEEVKASTAKRREMTQLAIEQKRRLEEEIIAQESAAKKVIMSRALKKKPVVKGEAKPGAVLDGTVVDSDANEGQVVEVIADSGETKAGVLKHSNDDFAKGGQPQVDVDDEEVEVEEVDDTDDEHPVEAVIDDAE